MTDKKAKHFNLFQILSISSFTIAIGVLAFVHFKNLETWEKILFFSFYFFILVLSLLLPPFFNIKKENKKLIEELKNVKDNNYDYESSAKIKYAEQISEIIQYIWNFTEEQDSSPNNFVANTVILLKNMSGVFKSLKGVDCCITLKTFSPTGSTNKELKLLTLARGASVSSNTNREPREDFKKNDESIMEFFKENTDLAKVLIKSPQDNRKGKSIFFHSNDLVNFSDYRHPKLKKEIFRISNNLDVSFHDWINNYDGDRENDWPLPYKSTLNVPLTLMERKINNIEKNTFLGTLCIDSSEKKVFNKSLDKIILQGLSEIIYIYYNAHLEKVKTNKK